MIFHTRRGMFPEDVVLNIDPAEAAAFVQEEPASQGLLGPALRVRGKARPRAPIFAAAGANALLPSGNEQSFVLYPFANQGAVKGEYAVFMDYEKT